MSGEGLTGAVYYLNADFDLSLRPRPAGLGRASLRATLASLSVQGLLLGGAGDAVIIGAGVPGDFRRYLRRQGVALPRLLRPPLTDRDLVFRPFGWNAEAIALNAAQARPSPHPGLEVVRLVNARSFSTAIEKDRFSPEGAGKGFTSAADAARWLAAQRHTDGGWVVKSDHGNAGTANRRLRGPAMSPVDVRFTEALLAEDDEVFVEPWRRRLGDMCTVFRLSPGGRVEGLRRHEAIYTRDGALIGVLFGGAERGRWDAPLDSAAATVAGEISRRGYFGPVCFDSFVYLAEGEERLRPLVDLNCRLPMSEPIYRLWSASLGDRTLLWRFFSTRKLREGTFAGVAGGDEGFRPRRRRGVLFTSPWSVELDGVPRRAPKIGVAFVGEGTEEVTAMERGFRLRWEKPSG